MRALVGRGTELATIVEFLERASTAPAAFVLDGEAGIGKTSLWRQALAAAEARGATVLSCRAAEAEAKLSFSALADLLEPVPDELVAALPPPQRRALDVALLRADAEDRGLDSRAAATALRSLLLSLSRSSAVLVAVDDVQWLDASSARALEFALRRTGTAPVGLLASRRTGAGGGPARLAAVLAEAESLSVGPLSLAATHELIRHRLDRSLPRPLLLRVHEAARGNPFYALEIARVVIEHETGLADPLPVPRDLSELVLRRLRRLRQATRDVLVTVAVAGHPDEPVVRAALGRDVTAELEEAEEAGVLERRGDRMAFAHPLFAAAVYSSATAARRRDAHHRLATAVDEPEQRARHLALAAAAPDEPVAVALDEAVAAAEQRGAIDAAAELAELAVKLSASGDGTRVAARRLALGELLRLTGDAERARLVLEQAAAEASGAPKARALIELAAVRYWTEGAVAGVETVDEALRAAEGDTALEAKAHADLAVYCDFDLERSYRHAQSALRLFEQLGPSADALAHSEAIAIAARDSLMLGHGLPVDEVDRAIAIEASATERGLAVAGRIPTFSGQWLKYVDDFDGARARLDGARLQALDEGDESALPNTLAHLAQTELWSGRWALAARHAEEACEIADRLGLGFGGPPAYRSLVDAHLGDVERARRTALDGLAVVERNPLAAPLFLRVLGFLDLSTGAVADAARHLTAALRHMDEVRILEPSVLRIHADAVEALVAAGDFEQAEAVLAPWEEQAGRVGISWSLATSARCRGLLEAAAGRTDEAIEALERALREHERLPMPFERARTLLAKGVVERRAKRKAAARASLEQALATFEALPAPLWASRARDELGRLGLRTTGRDSLTETEQRVAALAASGLTNKQVAARLYLSPKTVEANLARAYRKLGIRSRAELGARLATMGSRTTQT